MNVLRISVTSLLAFSLFLRATSAQAEDTWGLFQVDPGQIEPGTANTFRDLLQAEITKRNGVTVVRIEQTCGDIRCAIEAAKPADVDVAVIASLSALGEKVFVTVQAFDVEENEPKSSQQMKIDRIEELDLAAARVAEAFATYSNTDASAQLGTVTKQEAPPDTRRDADSGFSLSLGTLIPVNGYSGNANLGVLIDFGYWYESRNFAIQPRWGFRFRTDSKEDGNSYFEMPIDIGGFWLLSASDFSPLIGGGAGIRYIHETRRVQSRLGSVISASGQADLEDDGWGPSIYGRVGFMMLRTWTMRIVFSADYNITFIDLNDDGYPQSITATITAIF